MNPPMPAAWYRRYFDLVGIEPAPPSLENLNAIIRAHRRIPFETMSSLMRRHAAGTAPVPYVDLEEQPEWLQRFAAEHDRTGADVVYGTSAIRRGTVFRRRAGKLFWRLFNALSDVKVPPNPCTVRLMSRRYVDALLRMPENKGKIPFFAGIDGVRFKRMVVPGDVLRLEVEIGRFRRGFGKGTAKATVNGELACEGELLFALADAPKVQDPAGAAE